MELKFYGGAKYQELTVVDLSNLEEEFQYQANHTNVIHDALYALDQKITPLLQKQVDLKCKSIDLKKEIKYKTNIIIKKFMTGELPESKNVTKSQLTKANALPIAEIDKEIVELEEKLIMNEKDNLMIEKELLGLNMEKNHIEGILYDFIEKGKKLTAFQDRLRIRM